MSYSQPSIDTVELCSDLRRPQAICLFNVQHILRGVIAKDTELDIQQYPRLDRVPETEAKPKNSKTQNTSKTRFDGVASSYHVFLPQVLF